MPTNRTVVHVIFDHVYIHAKPQDDVFKYFFHPTLIMHISHPRIQNGVHIFETSLSDNCY